MGDVLGPNQGCEGPRSKIFVELLEQIFLARQLST